MVSHHAVDSLTTLGVGHIRHGTGVDDADVSLFVPAHGSHTHLLKHPSECGCLRKVQLTA